MFMTVTIWIEKSELELFKKFYDDVNTGKIIEKNDIPNITFCTYAPGDIKSYLQVNVLYDIYFIMNEMLNKSQEP